MLRLAHAAALLAAHDNRSPDDAALLHRQLRAIVAAGAIHPAHRMSVGRTSPALFERDGAARLAALATLQDAGFTVAELREIAEQFDAPADRPREPGVAYQTSGFAEAVAAIAAGEEGWRLIVGVLRGPAGRTFDVTISAPDTPTMPEGAMPLLDAAHRAMGVRRVLAVVVNLSARLRPIVEAFRG